jgi:hypothetical protein
MANRVEGHHFKSGDLSEAVGEGLVKRTRSEL